VADRRLVSCAAALAVVAALAGCAAVPVSGAARPLSGASGQPQQFVQPLPPPGPKPGDTNPRDIVLGFLHASASFAVDPDAARAYLAPGVKWNPAGTVTVVSPDLSFRQPLILPHAAGPVLQRVVVKGQRVATINSSGQYAYQSDAATSFTFTLGKYGSKLLIVQLPAGPHLLLTQDDFQVVFQPYNLYFYAPGAYPSGGLVPDPVYAPVEGPRSAQTTNVADSLVNGLIHDRGSSLAGPTMTEFPKGTTLLRPVTFSNQTTALVDLGGRAGSASAGQLALIYAQLKQTLTSSAYSPPVANAVQLAVNGRIVYPVGSGAVVPVAGSAVGGPRAQALYFASGDAVKQLWAGRKAAGPVPGLPPLGSPAGISALAASAIGTRQVAVAVPQGAGCLVRIVTLAAPYRSSSISVSGGPCTSLNWDNNGSLWAVTGSGIWVVQAGNTQAVQAGLPQVLTGHSRVLALRMAPDAVRAAMLVQTKGQTQLYVSAVKFGNKGVSFGPGIPVGTDLAADPVPGQRVPGVAAFGWYSPYYLLAVSGSQLYLVPLTGGKSTFLATGVPPGAQSLAAGGNELAVATKSGAVYTSVSPYIAWTVLPGRASAPAFPG
jgi:hypothetical protein